MANLLLKIVKFALGPGRADNTVTLQELGLTGKIMHFPEFIGFPAGLECSWLLPKQQHTWGEVESHISITSSSSRTPS